MTDTTFPRTTIRTSFGIPFTVLLLDAERPGPNRFRHNGNGMHDTVEFYDSRYTHTNFGQFVSSYRLADIMDHREHFALLLDGISPDWIIDAESMHLLRLWLADQIAVMNAEAERKIDAKLATS